MAQITAYRCDDGSKVRIPEHWLDHEVLGAPFTRTKPAPTPAATPVPSPGPAAATTPDQTPVRGDKKKEA